MGKTLQRIRWAAPGRRSSLHPSGSGAGSRSGTSSRTHCHRCQWKCHSVFQACRLSGQKQCLPHVVQRHRRGQSQEGHTSHRGVGKARRATRVTEEWAKPGGPHESQRSGQSQEGHTSHRGVGKARRAARVTEEWAKPGGPHEPQRRGQSQEGHTSHRGVGKARRASRSPATERAKPGGPHVVQ